MPPAPVVRRAGGDLEAFLELRTKSAPPVAHAPRRIAIARKVISFV
jgi:hypothetical protein